LLNISKVFELPILRVQHLQHSRFEDLSEIFARSFQIYNGKDSLIIVTRGSNDNKEKDFPASYFYLQSKSIKVAPFTSIRPQHFGNSPESLDSKASVAPKTQAAPEADDEQRQRETTAAVQIQAMWRRRWPRIRDRRTFLATPFAKTVTHVLSLSDALPQDRKIKIRAVLVADGVDLLVELDRLESTLTELHARATSRLEEMSVESLEVLDVILFRLGAHESNLKEGLQVLGDENLLHLIHKCAVKDIERLVMKVGDIVQSIKGGVEAIEGELSLLK
jgi:hypothetical protein